MKKTSQKKPAAPTGLAGTTGSTISPELHNELLDFAKMVIDYVTQPENWPLTPEEQCLFIRRVGLRASKINNMEPYRFVMLQRAVNADRATAERLGMTPDRLNAIRRGLTALSSSNTEVTNSGDKQS